VTCNLVMYGQVPSLAGKSTCPFIRFPLAIILVCLGQRIGLKLALSNIRTRHEIIFTCSIVKYQVHCAKMWIDGRSWVVLPKTFDLSTYAHGNHFPFPLRDRCIPLGSNIFIVKICDVFLNKRVLRTSLRFRIICYPSRISLEVIPLAVVINS